MEAEGFETAVQPQEKSPMMQPEVAKIEALRGFNFGGWGVRTPDLVNAITYRYVSSCVI
jgi:hypothetical protein